MPPSDRSPAFAFSPPSPQDGVVPAASTGAPVPRLWRSRSDRVVAGVLGGLAEKFGWEPRPVRLLYGLFGLFSIPLGGLPAIIPYLAVWSITRALGPKGRSKPRLWRSRSQVIVAGVLGGIAERLGISPTLVRVGFSGLTIMTMGVPGIVTYLVLWARTKTLDAPRWTEERDRD